MVEDSLVAINLYDKNTKKIYNKTLVPILFYWNGVGDLLESIFKDKDFINGYLNNINKYDDFINLSMSYFYFKFNEDGKEDYLDNTLLIKDYIKFKDFNSDVIIFNLIIPYFFNIYKTAIKEEYEKPNVFNQDIIVDIYKKIKEKYQEKILKKTFINLIRSKLMNDKIESENVNFIIDKLNLILQNED